MSRILGLIRDRLLGAFFGASLILDAFFVAFALPNMVRNLFGEGALSSAFIPRYTQMRENNPDEADAFAGLVIARLAIVLSSLAAISMAICGGLMLWGTHDKAVLVAILAIAQMPYLVFICISAIMAGVLNARHHFAVPAAAPVILNICMIAAVLLWEDVHILPYAVLCTGFLQLLLHVVALKAVGGVPKTSLKSTEALKEMRSALMPTIIAASVYQLNAFIDAIIAYEFLENATGAVVILYFANRLLQFPLALIAHGVGTAAYPEMSRVAMQGYEQTGGLLKTINRLLLALVIPAGVGLYLVAEPLVRCVYQAGAFGNDSVMRVVAVTQIYAFGLLPMALGKILVRSFHAHLDQRTPMFVAISGVILNLVLNIIFVVYTDLNECGLAIASVVSSLVIMLVYIALLAKRGTHSIFELPSLLLIVIMSAVMGAAVFALMHYWQLDEDASLLMRCLRLLACVVVGCLIYGVCLLSRLKQWRRAIGSTDAAV